MQVIEPVEMPSIFQSALRPFDGPQGPQAQGPQPPFFFFTSSNFARAFLK